MINKSARQFFIGFFLIAIFFILVWVGYTILRPIPFLFSLTLLLSLFYYIFFLKKLNIRFKEEFLAEKAKLISVFYLLLIFAVSLIVVKDYQNPKGNKPYFSNADHHALKSEAIAFQNSLTLYADNKVNNEGIRSCEDGTLLVLVKEDDIRLSTNNFYEPVFLTSSKQEQNGSFLLNPQFSKPLVSGTSLTDGKSILTFSFIGNSKIDRSLTNWFPKQSNDLYDINIKFVSNDQGIIGENLQNVIDSFNISQVTLRKGLGIMNLILRNSDSIKLKNSLRIQRWITRYGAIEILASKSASGTNTLNLFLSKNAIDAGIKVFFNSEELSPSSNTNSSIPIGESFFVGLGNDRDSFSVARVNSDIIFNGASYTHLLKFGKFGYKKLDDFSKQGRLLGRDELRFISNSPADITSSNIREGLLFHESNNDNAYTSLKQGVFQYENGPPESSLRWNIWPKHESNALDAKSGRFLLESTNGKIGWIYELRDFSKNAFKHTSMRFYMGLIMLLILIVTLLFPSPITNENGSVRSLLPLETPIWMMVYVMLTYRLLLLWRVSTFPPVEGISSYEFGSLQYFDNSFQSRSLPLPLTVIIFAFFILTLCLHRYIKHKRINSKPGVLPPRNKVSTFFIKQFGSKWGLQHFIVLVLSLMLKKLIPWEILTRICELLLPIFSYFYFSSKAIASEAKMNNDSVHFREKWSTYSIFQYWIYDRREFAISLFTFIYLAAQDRGFAVIFLVFLILKNVFLRFSRPISIVDIETKSLFKLFTNPIYHKIYGIIALVLFTLFLTWKGLPDFLLSNVRIIAIVIFPVSVYLSWKLLPKYYCNWKYINNINLYRIFPILLAIISISFIIPPTWKWIDDNIQEKLQNVKYRASLIHKPLSDVLREEAYGSRAERKIIETAQNQWFIHTFLDHAEQYPRRIGLQPHFRTGVDYITQTRDVVLPRYVIGEFGFVTMFILIVLITMPLLAYLIFFKLYNPKGQMDSESVTGLLALAFLFVASLVVWMSSTNRFVFFGQDFPFLSLTSRVSVVLPLTMILILLTRRPMWNSSKKTFLQRFTILTFFIVLVFTVVIIGGKSSLLRENHFQPRMDDIRDRIDRQVNNLFEEAQRRRKMPQQKLVADKEFLYAGVWLKDMTNLPEYKTLYDSLSRYEQTMIDALVEKPALGFDQRSPIHIIRSDGFYQLHFNNWFHLELPFYESDKAWRGDVYQPVSDDGSLTRKPPDDISRYIHQLPSGYFMPGEKRFAMIDIYNLKAKLNSPEVMLYKPKEGVLKTLDLQGFAERIDEQDLLLYRIPNQHGKNNYERFQTWNLADGNRQYFGFNAKVNGRWRLIYPMAGLFPWIREWTNAGAFHMQQRGGTWLDSSLILNLDYDLTRSTSLYLHDTLRNPPNKKDGVLISIVAADGDGRIRVMTDHVVRSSRTPIDPNNQDEIDKLQREQYFNRDPEAERYQWGNTNLLHMRDGPGSSIKPILFAAVSSQRNLEWEKLKYKSHTGKLIQKDSKGGFLVEHYAGLDLKKEGLKWPEPDYSDNNSNLETYIAKSRNIHHSIIVFLGSYTRKDFPGGTLRDKLRPSNPNATFPVVGLDNATYALPNPPQWPMDPVSGRPFGNSNSMMAVGLSELFGLETQSSFSSGRLTERTDCSMLPDSLAYRNVWAFPERSYFDQAERTGNFSSAIIQTTLGGGIFRVTPLQMLQMYGRLFNHDQGFRLSIDSVSGNSRSWLNLNPNDWTAASFNQFLDQGRGGHKGLIESMKSVFEVGTANYLPKNLKKGGFTIYAKTGTTGNAAINYSSKRLFVAIVKDGAGGNPVDFKSRRKFFIYMTLDRAYESIENKWFEKVFSDLIERVMKSESFKEYMMR